VEKNQLINVSKSLVFAGFLVFYKWQIIIAKGGDIIIEE